MEVGFPVIARPIFRVEVGLSVIARPIFDVGVGLFLVARPIFHVGVGLFFVGRPIFHLARPIFHVAVGLFLVGRPIFHVAVGLAASTVSPRRLEAGVDDSRLPPLRALLAPRRAGIGHAHYVAPSMSFSSRPATQSDYPLFARLFLQLETNDPVMTEAAWLAHMAPHTQVHEVGGQPAAYTVVKVLGENASVLHVVVDEPFRGRGLGLAIMQKHAAELRTRGCRSWFLHVKKDNRAAIRTYEKCGMRIHCDAVALRLPWAVALRLPRAEDVEVVEVDGADHAALAAIAVTLDFVAGRLASLATIGRRLFRLTKNGADVGFAAFDPAFPGAMPFRVGRPEHAGALLQAMRPHAMPEHDAVGLVVEASPETVAALRAAGAELRFAMHQMRGPL